MKKIKLNPKQIVDLINNKRVCLASDKVVEVFDDEIIYNNNGQISRLDNLHLEFSPPEEDKPFLRKLLCEYFNCEPFQIICIEQTVQDAEFRIRFSPEKELGIIILTEAMAKYTMRDMIDFDEDYNDIVSKNQIGPYHRLKDSDYFFRWDNL